MKLEEFGALEIGKPYVITIGDDRFLMFKCGTEREENGLLYLEGSRIGICFYDVRKALVSDIQNWYDRQEKKINDMIKQLQKNYIELVKFVKENK